MAKISVVIRAHNDIAWIRRTLQTLLCQRGADEFELVTVDNHSTDGTAEVIRQCNVGGINLEWPAGKYVPGKVLNAAIRHCTGDYVVFNNADSVPAGADFLAELVRPLTTGAAELTYARQTPRPDARPLIRKDYARAFGDGKTAKSWRHFFSLAAAAAPRELLLNEPFREDLQYSEDIEWSYRLKQQGCRIAYVPTAAVEHSHNYNLPETARRFYNEGVANAKIFGDEPGVLTGFLLPLGRELLRDTAFLIRERSVMQMPYELTFRIVQRWNLFCGCRKGEFHVG